MTDRPRPRPVVAHLTSVHPATDVRILHRECRTLAEAGYDVWLVGPHDADERVDGVRIRALPRSPGRFHRMTALAVRAYYAAARLRADVYHFHDPELIPYGVLLKLGGARVVYDVHEDVPRDVLQKEWIAAGLRRPIASVASGGEAAASAILDAIVAATPSIAARFPRSKTALVQNFPRIGELDVALEAAPFGGREPLAAYVGAISEERGALMMARAMAALPRDLPARLVLAGDFSPPALADTVRTLAPDRIETVGWLSRPEVAALLGRAGAGMVAFQPAPNHFESYPTKLFEYMAAGLPVIASDFPLWRRIVSEAGSGLLVDPTDPAAIAGALVHLLGHPEEAAEMGRRGRQAVIERYSWDRQATSLLALYARLTAT